MLVLFFFPDWCHISGQKGRVYCDFCTYFVVGGCVLPLLFWPWLHRNTPQLNLNEIVFLFRWVLLGQCMFIHRRSKWWHWKGARRAKKM